MDDHSHSPGKVFLGGLESTTTGDDVLEYCRAWGEVTDCVVFPGRGFGFVSFATSSEREVFLTAPEGHLIRGRQIDCKKAVPRGNEDFQPPPQFKPSFSNPPGHESRERDSSENQRGQKREREPRQQANHPRDLHSSYRPDALPNRIFVGNLPHDVTQEEIKDTMEAHGTVEEVTLAKGQNGQLRGFGFVSFLEASATDTALHSEAHVRNERIDVKPAFPRSSDRRPGSHPAPGGSLGGRGPPRGGAKRAGDWDCDRCGHLNFAFREECRQCNRPKPSSAGSQLYQHTPPYAGQTAYAYPPLRPGAGSREQPHRHHPY